jgi:hypothetical protein
MPVKFSNGATTSLALGVGSTETEIEVLDASVFPDCSADGDFTFVTLVHNTGALEIVKVTGVTANTFTVVRAQDGTTALAFSAGSQVELRLTAALLNAAAHSGDEPEGSGVAMSIALGG